MNYKGTDVRNVFHLRTPEDANSIARLANNKNAVIVGTSFVGEKNTHLQEYFDARISIEPPEQLHDATHLWNYTGGMDIILPTDFPSFDVLSDVF